MVITVAADIATRMQEVLDVMGWTPDDLSQKAGVRPLQVRLWINSEEGTKPPLSRLRHLCEVMGWPIEMFYEGGPRPRQSITKASAHVRPIPVGQPDVARLYTGSGESMIRMQVERDIVARLYASGPTIPVSQAVRAVLELSEAWMRMEENRGAAEGPSAP